MFAVLRRFVTVELVLLVVLVCSVAAGGMLPAWAQLVGVEGAHVCHCSTDHHDCVCAHCGTDPDGKAFRAVSTVKGRCGEDEVAFGGRGFNAILSPPIAGVPAAEVVEATAMGVSPASITRLRARPPTPPPRAA